MKENFLIKIETWHKPDMGHLENVSTLNLAKSSLLGSLFLRGAECDFEYVLPGLFRCMVWTLTPGRRLMWSILTSVTEVKWSPRYEQSSFLPDYERKKVIVCCFNPLEYTEHNVLNINIFTSSLEGVCTAGSEFILACLKIHMSKNANHHGSGDLYNFTVC